MLSYRDTVKPCKGEFHIDVYKEGKLVEEISDHNLVVDVARGRLAELAAGLSNAYITQIGCGSGSAPEGAEDTALTDQQLFPLTSATVEERDAKFSFTIDNSQANGMAIHEFGLFCSDGLMFTHRVRDGVIEKKSDIQLKGYWILHF